MWVNIVILAISLIATAVALQVRPPEQKPASFEDINLPTADEGRPIPVVYGTYLVQAPNVVWWGNPSTEPVRTKSGK